MGHVRVDLVGRIPADYVQDGLVPAWVISHPSIHLQHVAVHNHNLLAPSDETLHLSPSKERVALLGPRHRQVDCRSCD